MSCRLVLMLILFSTVKTLAQFSYSIDQSIPVSTPNGDSLKFPWAGGINGTQFNTMDINGDGAEDLVLFERMTNKVLTFLNLNDNWVYSPEHEILFPQGLTNWLLIKDFNCDGHKDIFTGDIFGIRVFENITEPGQGLQWRNFLFYVPGATNKSEVLVTKGFNGLINLQLEFDDLPAFVDADYDGDIDIFNTRFAGGGGIEYHQNFSQERYGSCDSLAFERVTRMWGEVTECRCENFAFHGEECLTGGRVKHAGGKALLAIDMDNDHDHELIFSEADCPNLFLLANEGDHEVPVVNAATKFPGDVPAEINFFPAAFYEDVDFDGLKDLIVSPNLYRKDILEQDLKSSTWLYKNTGTEQLPVFTFARHDFLQNQMIDVGDNAVPTFFDIDSDGDPDLFIGYNSDASGFGSIELYRNIGSAVKPHFQLEDDDYLNIKSLAVYGVKPQIEDINGDGRMDLAFSASRLPRETLLYFILNNGSSVHPFELSEIRSIDIGITSLDNFHLTHIDGDGLIDLLVGRWTGSLEYWRNNGALNSPSFFLQNPTFLDIDASVVRQALSCHSADLDNDANEDLVLSDQSGKVSIISNFKNSTLTSELTQIVYHPLSDSYENRFLGRAWPTSAHLFDSKRAAIVLGTMRGGIEIWRNEEKELQFQELVLHIYPNPVNHDTPLKVSSNMTMQMQIISSIGQLLTTTARIEVGLNEISLPPLASGVYILRFSAGSRSIHHRIVVE
jgi:hypothetical protein